MLNSRYSFTNGRGVSTNSSGKFIGSNAPPVKIKASSCSRPESLGDSLLELIAKVVDMDGSNGVLI